MASTSGSEPVAQSKQAARGSSGSQDPEALARDIERTREDLAHTLDAIAEKVSPKRVATRTREQLTIAAQGALATAKVKVAEVTASAKELTSGGGSHAALPSGGTTSAPGAAPPGVRPEYVAGGALGLLLLLWARRRRRARRLPRITAKDLARAQAHARALELAQEKHRARARR